MKDYDFEFHLETLREMDPDELVLELGITTDEIIDRFGYHVDKYIQDNFGDWSYDDEEDELEY